MNFRFDLSLSSVVTNGVRRFVSGLTNANSTGGYAMSCSGSLIAYAANTLRWGCLGGKRAVLVEAVATNKVAKRNAAPVDVSSLSVSTSGTIPPTVSLVDQSESLAAVPALSFLLADGTLSGQVYRLNNEGGDGLASVGVPGVTGSTNTHFFEAWVKNTGVAGKGGIGPFVGLSSFTTTTGGGNWEHLVGLTGMDTATRSLRVHAAAATSTYFILMRLTEADSIEEAGSIIVTTTDAVASRAADLVTAPITADVSNGVRVRGVFRLDAVSGSYDRVFQLDDGTTDNRIYLRWNSTGGNFNIALYSDGVSQGSLYYASAGLGDVIDVDLTFTADAISGTINGTPIGASLSGGYTQPTVARIGGSTFGGDIPARLLCSDFIVTGVAA